MSEPLELIRTLSEAKIPLMRIITTRKDPRDGHPCVYVDDRDDAYAITEQLIQLDHHRIGFLWGGGEHHSSPKRGQSYEDALKDRPTAIFGFNDEIAAGMLAAAHSGGINVPYGLALPRR